MLLLEYEKARCLQIIRARLQKNNKNPALNRSREGRRGSLTFTEGDWIAFYTENERAGNRGQRRFLELDIREAR